MPRRQLLPTGNSHPRQRANRRRLHNLAQHLGQGHLCRPGLHQRPPNLPQDLPSNPSIPRHWSPACHVGHRPRPPRPRVDRAIPPPRFPTPRIHGHPRWRRAGKPPWSVDTLNQPPGVSAPGVPVFGHNLITLPSTDGTNLVPGHGNSEFRNSLQKCTSHLGIGLGGTAARPGSRRWVGPGQHQHRRRPASCVTPKPAGQYGRSFSAASPSVQIRRKTPLDHRMKPARGQ